MIRSLVVPLAFGFVLLAGRPARADVVFNLQLTADGNSRWYEFFSDAFAQLDRGFVVSGVPNPALDGFFLISPNADPFNPTVYQQIGGGGDVFPNEANFSSSYSLTYADAGLTGIGEETAAITALSLDFDNDIADDDSLLGVGYTTTPSNVSGTVRLLNGLVTGIDLTSNVQLAYDGAGLGLGTLLYDGVFGITGSQFSLFVDDSNPTFPTYPDARYVWDVQGTVTNLAAVPEPSSFALLTLAGGIFGARRWRRRAATHVS
ncbi:hypothetical protein Pan44_38090 [Caulifigura coniformis]|uniref:Ice-binding protein C-terminal domain-containing protein n=1 Tax=Caulifigura coniformis TaxID=2527983 RepID=A0A517SI07_9PLAN|nr:PEP-CTERM sorting domain-containing protein [Caulifigura coniformis]QDT55761.1 hypothetical protein Pan44_38090 [Caulifigura coniformis]